MFLSHSFNIDNFSTQYIDTQSGVQAIIPLLNSSKAIAIDLEFDRNRYRYGFNLCLIQIEAQQQIFLIDPIAIGVNNLTALWQVLENPDVLKIMHSPNEDITLLKLSGCKPKNIGDTEMAARILGQKQVSLGMLLSENLGIVLDKGQQTSNWNTRPLAMQQLVYAAYDVLHLARLYYCLCEKVEDLGRTAWHKELCTDLEQLEYIPDPEPHRSLPDANKLSAFHLHILKNLYWWRENLAKRWNMPPSNVVGNRSLVDWVTTPNFDFDYWQNTRGMIGRIRNDRDFQIVRQLMQRSVTEAEKLGLAKVWERPRRGVYLRKREDAEVLKQKLHELRAKLRETHGETVGALMLSATQCDTLVAGKDFSTLRKFAQPYIREAAHTINLDMDYFKL